MYEIKLYVSGNVVINNDYMERTVNQEFIDALTFMYKKWPHLIQVHIFDTAYEEKIKESAPELNIMFMEREDLPQKLDKLHHLIDTNFDYLYRWSVRGGKGIAFDFVKSSKESWEGLKMARDMTKDEFINVFRKTMHLYN